MKKELNTSASTYEQIIEGNIMYVDKTDYLYKMVRKYSGQYFLSRPRRFGKSMTLSTLKAIFKGKKDLFKGLYIYDKPFDWNVYPIIHLSMNKMGSQTIEEFEENLCLNLQDIAEDYEIEITVKRS